MTLKVKARGGKGGTEWDDGSEYQGVTKIYVRVGREGIQFIKLEYVKNGAIVVGPIHGVSGPGLTQEFEIDHSKNEYMISVEGSYDESTGVIQSLKFITSRKNSDLMGFDKGTKFSIGVTDMKIVGFHGFAEKNLNTLGAYFIRVPPVIRMSEVAQQGVRGQGFYDSGNYDGIRKIYVKRDGDALRYLKTVYDKAGNQEICEHGRKEGMDYEFTLNYPYEYITSVEGSFGVGTAASRVNHYLGIESITFNTSSGRTSQIGVYKGGSEFKFESKGNVIVGFHGRAYDSLNTIGVYYSSFIPQEKEPAQKLDAKGGNGGTRWDDGSDYLAVTKIHVRGDLNGIQFIKIEYVKKDETATVGPIHGVFGGGMTETFDIKHLENEYLISVEGYYNETTGVIQSLKFQTNTKTSELLGYNEGTKFSISASGKRIIGFHGFAEKYLNSLGAYFVKTPSTKSAIQGEQTDVGKVFDDGGDYDSVRKVYVTFDGAAITYVKFAYQKGDNEETRERGVYTGTPYEFKVNNPNEYITSVEGSYGVVQKYGRSNVITSLTFKTSSGRTSQVFGKVSGNNFVLESKDNVIVGFHGRVGDCVYAIGAYYSSSSSASSSSSSSSSSSPTPTPSEKLQAKGGDGGNSWDDGAFKNVKKIYVGQGDVGVASLKFEYENETSEVVVGKEHGKATLLGYDEFELDYPSEYITSVEGYYDTIGGAPTGVITMLRFKTNKRTSPPFGLESGSSFELKKDGHKITGFHGSASTIIHKIGVHVVPITN